MEIRINNVTHIYNEHTLFEETALEDVNLSLDEKGIIGIIGKSGSGKSTLIQLLNALIVPSYGNVEIADFDIKKNMKVKNINDLRRKVGLVFQFPEEQFFNPTVREEVSFALKYFRYRNDRIHKQVSEALTMVGLNDSYLERNVFELSSGEQRMIAIASVMVFNPKIIILDEPTAGLDYRNKKKFMNLARRLRDRYNKTVIIVTHDVDMLNVIADHIVALDNGKIVLSGSKNEVFKNATLLHKHGLRVPKIVEFTGKVITEKGVILGRHTDVKDLIKDIYRNV
ncbi:MAG: ATP-binding cassette domain-containing protein [Bacilli bacterium]|nr:ATP-binding cassette domain-containing protein [Bacilli bacterium]